MVALAALMGLPALTAAPQVRDPDDPTTLDAAWTAVSHGVLRDRRSDLAAILDFATLVMAQAEVRPRTLEVDSSHLLGIELVAGGGSEREGGDGTLALAGRLRSYDLLEYTQRPDATLHLVARIAKDSFVQKPVRFEIQVRWGGPRSGALEIAVFSQITEGQIRAMEASNERTIAGDEYTVRWDLDQSPDASVSGAHVMHPHQEVRDRWQETQDAATLSEKARVFMETGRRRFHGIQRALRFD